MGFGLLKGWIAGTVGLAMGAMATREHAIAHVNAHLKVSIHY